MGNSMTCFHPNGSNHNSSRRVRSIPQGKGGKSPKASPEKPATAAGATDDAAIKQQALEAVLLFRRHQSQRKGGGGGGGWSPLPTSFDRSTSVRDSASSRKRQSFPRSSSTRPPSTADPLLQPHQLTDLDKEVDSMETKHFVLVHGGGFGAWCWYKTIALLKQSQYKVDAVDLVGSGINSFDTNGVTSLAQYTKPLTDFLEKLGDGEKVILVGHDFGGACISYAMEMFPSKIAKAVFIAAAMLAEGQSTADLLSVQAGTDDLMQRAKILLYGSGDDHPPTAIDFDKALFKDLFFNRSPDKDFELAMVSMRPIPLAPILERLSLSEKKYGSVRRFYIRTPDDSAIPISLQESMIDAQPPENVFSLKGSDHSPFFSKPQALHRVLVEISKLPSNQAVRSPNLRS